MSRKIKLGIDIDEIFRSKWLQFDRYFVQEFGDTDIPNQPYVYDLFNEYPWKPITEEIKELREPEDMPENINPIDYQVDEKTGEAPADFALFKKTERITLTPKEAYNRFMYEDFVFEIHALAPMMYRGMDLDVKNFLIKYDNEIDITIFSIENQFSIPSTLSFLSKMTARFKNYKFVNDSKDMWKNCDILITSNPEILRNRIPFGKKIIKINRPYNENLKIKENWLNKLFWLNALLGLFCKTSLTVLQINDLTNNNDFKKIIKYNK